jgi:hypothetical protein
MPDNHPAQTRLPDVTTTHGKKTTRRALASDARCILLTGNGLIISATRDDDLTVYVSHTFDGFDHSLDLIL